MSTIIAVMSSIASIIPRRSSGNTGPTGADAVRTAVNELKSLHEQDFTAVLGEPDIEENVGRFFKDPKIVIPVKESPFNGADQLVFDVPEGRNDERSQFRQLLEVFDIDFENMETLEGSVVPIKFYGGNIAVAWHEMEEAEPPKGSEENEWTEEDIDDVQSANDVTLNVEEETYSADDSEEAGTDD